MYIDDDYEKLDKDKMRQIRLEEKKEYLEMKKHYIIRYDKIHQKQSCLRKFVTNS